MKNFALIGLAGYIAPRHLQAIRDTGNTLIAATDRSDSVGIADRYFPDAHFFTEIERFDRHLEKLRRSGESSRVHYVSICSPNYLHDAHIRMALRVNADAICEKPLVLKPWNLDAVAELEEETGSRVYNVLQLRLHPAMVELKKRLDASPPSKQVEVDLRYVTARGRWYDVSWKADPLRSGGIAMNIGVHFYDILVWLFGNPVRSQVHARDARRMAGVLELERARVRWFLSTEMADLPEATRAAGQRAFRTMTMDGQELEFSEGFTDLHTRVYEEILAGRGFGIEAARPSIALVHQISTQELEPCRDPKLLAWLAR